MTTATLLTSVADLRAFLTVAGPFEIAIWDFDGVVGDTEPVQAQVYRDMLAEQGVAPPPDFFEDLAGHPEGEIWSALQDRFSIAGKVSDLRAERIERVTPMLAEQVRPNWFVRPGVEMLRESGASSLVVSSGNQEVVDRCLDAWRLRSLFDGISAMSGDAGDVPKRERLRESLQRAGRALVVEDSGRYLRLAAEFGAVTIGVPHGLNGEAAEVADAVLLGGTEQGPAG